jgi:hypothetical protein
MTSLPNTDRHERIPALSDERDRDRILATRLNAAIHETRVLTGVQRALAVQRLRDLLDEAKRDHQ